MMIIRSKIFRFNIYYKIRFLLFIIFFLSITYQFLYFVEYLYNTKNLNYLKLNMLNNSIIIMIFDILWINQLIYLFFFIINYILFFIKDILIIIYLIKTLGFNILTICMICLRLFLLFTSIIIIREINKFKLPKKIFDRYNYDKLKNIRIKKEYFILSMKIRFIYILFDLFINFLTKYTLEYIFIFIIMALLIIISVLELIYFENENFLLKILIITLSIIYFLLEIFIIIFINNIDNIFKKAFNLIEVTLITIYCFI